MVNKFKVLELFGGIGACSNALKRLDIPYEIVDYVEIDKYAVKSYNAIYRTNFEPQDITTWNKDVEVDLIMHGSPCQDFSLAGKQAGGDKDSGTRSSLMYETLRIVGKLKPKYVIWENVKNILSKKHIHNFNAYLGVMEELGYTNYYQVLNAKDYGIPQNRERVFTISILGNDVYEFPLKQELKLRLKDVLETEVDEKYYLSNKMIDKIQYNKNCDCIQVGTLDIKGHDCIKRVYSKNGISPTLTDMQGGNRQPKILIKNNTKQGYLEAYDGDSVNLEQPNSKTRRGRVGKQVLQTLTTSCNQGVIVNEIDNPLKGKTKYGWHFEQNVYSEDSKCSRSVKAGGGSGNIPKVIKNDLRIRKLTPKECWRLMGFQDEDFEKAEKVNSNTQLYKQAGNSIVVNVLIAILTNLLIPGQAILQEKQLSIYDMG